MASLPFTLAALATSAVPNLEVVGVRGHDGDPDYASAVITTDRGELLVRVPRSEAAEVRQSAELLGIAAFSEGSRALLPFAVPETLGITRAGETRAVISTLLTGSRFAAEDLAEDALLIESIAESLAAVHSLPGTVAQQGGLPVRSSRDLRLLATRLMDRAAATRLMPKTVLERWERTLETAELWDFSPTMVHGSLSADQLYVEDDRITGIDGWAELSVGDPAADFAWLLAAGPDALDAVVSRYARLYSVGSLTFLRTRAVLYRELEIARWLLHGVEAHDQEVIDDAVAMLDRLVDRLAGSAALVSARTPLNEEQVEALLDETPEVVDHLSDTAAYEALDEDRMFGVEPAFVESPDERENEGEGSGAEPRPGDAAAGDAPAGGVAGGDGAGGAGGSAGAAERVAGSPEPDADEQATAPIDDEDLPGPEKA